jgi:hypothetical protein
MVELDELATGALAYQAVLLLGRDNDGSLPAFDHHVFGSLFHGPAYRLAETCLGILQLPVA